MQADGYPDGVLSPVQITAGHTTRADIAVGGTRPATVSTNAPAPKPPAPVDAQTLDAPVREVARNVAQTHVTSDLWKRWLKGETITRQDVEVASLHSPR